jgi:hypothetical protein
VSEVRSVWGIGGDVMYLLGSIETLELKRAFAVPYVCDCGIAWKRMVLGTERQWAGGRALLGGAEGGRAIFGWQVCDLVVTPGDLRRLEMEQPRIGSLLLLCLGSALELSWWQPERY